jgi:hypothetical protein
MEEPGFVTKRWGMKLWAVVLSLSFLFFLTVKFFPEKNMETRGSIKGILKNKAGMPVADAIIMIKEGNHDFNDVASVSNSNGEFFVSGIVIPGKYVLQIQHDSGSITKEINVASADTILSVSF